MKEILVNLKRFDVPRKKGGICPFDNPEDWINSVIEKTVRLGLGEISDISLTFFLPEALIISAVNKLKQSPLAKGHNIRIGSQGVFRKDINPGVNFGAFTTNLPATAAKNMGCSWTIIGHSEERADKLGILEEFEPTIKFKAGLLAKANETVDRIINYQINNALAAGLNVLMCVGETAEEKGDGAFDAQKSSIKAVLKRQLLLGLKGIKEKLNQKKLAIGYEPIWAIGPGKIPPGKEYISFVSQYIKETVRKSFGFVPIVVYGGGLKEENAAMISNIETIDGGLVALTRFSGEIAFEVEGLKRIIEQYRQ
ncbi:MAG: triose-phosphate isomerase [Halanaerobiales bacterium]|nr:triose-phosphate isomerase [Halanaerobiales bacterium]